MSKKIVFLLVLILCASASSRAYSTDTSGYAAGNAVNPVILGDCDGDGTVTIPEVQSAINMFLGLKQVSSCVDTDNSNDVSISDVQRAIINFLCGGSGSGCGIAAPPKDTAAPTTPISIVSFPSSTQVALVWSPSFDDVGVVGYEVWRNEALLGTATATSYTDTAVTAGTTYSYQIKALDQAGNRSMASTSVSAVIPAGSKAAVAVTPNTASAGSRVSVSLTPGSGGYYGQVSVFTSSQFDVTAAVPSGFAFAKLGVCPNGACTSPLSVDFQIPLQWPTGSYFFCASSPPSTCARVEVSNASALPDQGVCSAVSLQGQPAHKANVVFVADNFNESNIATFRSKVEEYRAALLSVSPFAENSSKFNFWKVERLGPLADGSYDMPYLEYWSTMVSGCGGADVVVVVEGPGYNNALTPFSVGHDLIPWVMVTSDSPGLTLVHEFGHAFADLGDEYENTSVYVAPDRIGLRPNSDVAFCPKWCSGQPNTASTLSSGFDCWSAWQSFNSCIERQGAAGLSQQAVEECWFQTADLHNGWSAGMAACDFGTGCRTGTGCFWNAKATNIFRSTRQSIMSGGGLSTGFNPPSMDAILLKLGQYN